MLGHHIVDVEQYRDSSKPPLPQLLTSLPCKYNFLVFGECVERGGGEAPSCLAEPKLIGSASIEDLFSFLFRFSHSHSLYIIKKTTKERPVRT